jgi:hypothetical protein
MVMKGLASRTPFSQKKNFWECVHQENADDDAAPEINGHGKIGLQNSIFTV